VRAVAGGGDVSTILVGNFAGCRAECIAASPATSTAAWGKYLGRGVMAGNPPMHFTSCPAAANEDLLVADLDDGPYSQALMFEKWISHFPQMGRFSSHCSKSTAALPNWEARSEPSLYAIYSFYSQSSISYAFCGVSGCYVCTSYQVNRLLGDCDARLD